MLEARTFVFLNRFYPANFYNRMNILFQDMGDKMERIQRITGEYLAGDSKKRLDLYLEYRDLRRDFDLIDRKEDPIKTVNLFRPVMPPALSLIKSFLCTLLSRLPLFH